jgi:hypothetical protein
MKIVYDYQTFTVQNYGGISRYFCQLRKHISMTEHDAEIFSTFYTNKYMQILLDGRRRCFHSLFLESLVNAIKNKSQPIVTSYNGFKAGGSLESTFFDSVMPIKLIYMQPKDFAQQYVSRKIKLIGCYGLMSTKILKNRWYAFAW